MTTDARKNAELNGVHLPDGRKVSWDVAYLRPYWNDPDFWAAARPVYEEES